MTATTLLTSQSLVCGSWILLLAGLPKFLGIHLFPLQSLFWEDHLCSFILHSICPESPPTLPLSTTPSTSDWASQECRVCMRVGGEWGVTHWLLSHLLYKVTQGAGEGRGLRGRHQPQPISWAPVSGRAGISAGSRDQFDGISLQTAVIPGRQGGVGWQGRPFAEPGWVGLSWARTHPPLLSRR